MKTIKFTCLHLAICVLADIEIVEEPKDIRVISGENVVLPCRITGVPEAERDNSVQWLKGTNELGYFALGYPPLRRERYTQREGPTDYSLEVTNVQLDDDSFFECQVTHHRLRSEKAHLIVLQPPQDVTLLPFENEAGWPKLKNGELQIIEGEEARLRCIASSSKPKTDIKWTLSDVRALNSSDSITGTQTFTTVSETVLIPTKADHGLTVSCTANSIALEKAGEMVRSATLNILSRPEVSVVMSSNELRVGDDLYARCVGESNPAVERYEWFIGDEQFEETGAEIRVNNITKELNGQLLICQATNAIGVTTADTLLDIQYSPESTNAINDRIVVNASDSVDIACTFDGNPAPQVTWIKSGVPDVLGEGLKLSFQSVKQEDSGVYQCTATSSLGSAHNNVTLVVRGPPIITSEQEQVGDYLECGFISEPKIKSIKITDIEVEDVNEAIIYQSFDGNETIVLIPVDTGKYECRVENDLGVQSRFIILGQKRIPTEIKVGIIVGFVLVLFIVGSCLCVRVKYLPVKHLKDSERKKLAIIGQTVGEDRRHDSVTEKTILFGRKTTRRASDESTKFGIVKKRDNGAVPKDKVPETNSSERSTVYSGHDDGYGTESGSNHKVSDSSQSESNSDYEVHVSSLISKVSVDGQTESEPSKIRVVFDDDTIATYRPHNIRSQTQRIQYRKQLLSNTNKARSVSQV